jgi:2-polyprenyl-3-methyl-5-hydroxy-6-metoxy-1,4-benzoquinol methylase
MITKLHEDRLAAVYDQLLRARATRVLDLGCGDGALYFRMAMNARFRELVGVDLSAQALDRLQRRLIAADLFDQVRTRLIRSSFTEPEVSLSGFDAALLVETIEHIDPADLSLVEGAVFGRLRPATIIVTTPNVEFNDLLGVPRRRFRHPGHRFEWTRRKFRSWSAGVGLRTGYSSSFHDVGASHPVLGGPTQMAVFERA